ncbi:hypothetical protein [Streptomyces mirabilis]|uniref:hypothetical protein n=1 Tax=Streptomyces mirabilis TaxID=68239 RepID=UPI00367CD5D5
MPVSLVMMTPIVQALHGRGPLPVAASAGLRVMASAPLHGGELPGMVGQELAGLIRPGLTPAQACVLGGRVMPRSDGRPSGRLRCATLEGGG